MLNACKNKYLRKSHNDQTVFGMNRRAKRSKTKQNKKKTTSNGSKRLKRSQTHINHDTFKSSLLLKTKKTHNNETCTNNIQHETKGAFLYNDVKIFRKENKNNEVKGLNAKFIVCFCTHTHTLCCLFRYFVGFSTFVLWRWLVKWWSSYHKNSI